MKRIRIVLLLLLLAILTGCSSNIKKQLDSETLSSLESIYNKADTKESFNRWLKHFDNYTITYSDEYTYVIGSVDTNINIFSYESFEIVDDYWVIDSIKTDAKLYDTPTLNNLTIDYGDNGHWFINNHDTNIDIVYKDKIETYEIEDYFKMKSSGFVPTITSNDSQYNREFYVWMSGVEGTQMYSTNGVFVNIQKPRQLDEYMLQVNDLNKTKPLSVGKKYNISFDVTPNAEDTKIAVVLYKNNNEDRYFYREYCLDKDAVNHISINFTCEDPSLFLKIYLGKYKSTYTIGNFKIQEDYMDYVIGEIESAIPSVVYDSFILPTFDTPYLKIKYETTYSTIVNNGFVYIDPEGRVEARIDATINYCGKDYSESISFKVKSPITKLPEIRITLNTDTSISMTDDYSRMSLDFIEYDEHGNKNVLMADTTGGIRVRGNSTSTFSKKPYRIKFDSKQSFFGLSKAKSWVLLANHSDQSLMRVYLAHTIATLFDSMEFIPSAHYVDLYVNDEYYGNYLLTEQMQVGKGRVDIDSEADEVDTGYLLEYDMHIEGTEGIDYFKLNNENSVYFIKSPDRSDGLTNEQFNYIKNYISSVDTAIKNRSGYNELIDIDTFIDFFWMQEIFKNIDCNQGSIYMYKEEGSKLKMGPIWDFDLSCGNDSQDSNAVKTDGWFSFLNYKNQWMYNLMKDREVVNLFKKRWHEKYEDILKIINTIPEIYDYIEDSALRNFKIHDVIGKEKTWYTVDKVYNIKTYEGQVEYLYNWLLDRVEWINNNVDSL